MNEAPEVSVVVCTYNRAHKLAHVLQALGRQTVGRRAEVIVVDDGSIDETADVASRYDVLLLRRETNGGYAEARNRGALAVRAPIVAFTDDDCVPADDWLEQLLPVFENPQVIAAGGRTEPLRVDTLNHRYLDANNPLAPLEADLALSEALPYRLWLYLKRNASFPTYGEERVVYSLPTANFAVRRNALHAVGLFDPANRFGGEDEDLCHRIRKRFGGSPLVFVPQALVHHDYEPGILDTLRRSLRSGKASLANTLRHEHVPPTVFPVPVIVSALVAASAGRRKLLVIAALLPLIVWPRWLRLALARRSPEPLAFAYLQVLQEACHNLGCAAGWLSLRSSSRGRS